jgi:hypothetical protein
MSQLAKLQANFQAYLYEGGKNAAFKKEIIDDQKIGATKRLGIYYDAYRLRIIEALISAYPKLHVLLGDDLFNNVARAYIDQYPSTYRNMRWIGDQMVVHLADMLPQHPIAAELASFEWALGLAFDAHDAPMLRMHDVAEIPPEAWGNFKFELHPSVQLLDLHLNVIPIWQALDKEEMPPVAEKIDKPCLVWRSDLNSHYRSLETIEYLAIKQIKAGASFGDLCENLYATLGDAATQQAAHYLAGWLEAGLISKVET